MAADLILIGDLFSGSTYNCKEFRLYDLCYQSQIDGFWRFAAPFSFLSQLLAPGIRRSDSAQKEK